MDKHEKHIKTALEIMQWALILFTLFACLFICPRVKQHIEDEKCNKLYQQISVDQRIEKLNRDNLILTDSISNLKRDTVYIYTNTKKK